MTVWDPGLYLHFADERQRPFWELVARIPLEAPRRVVDLGCGPGTATVGLCARWPDAVIVGVDNSAPMIEQAAARARPGRLSFVLDDLRTWMPDVPPEVILSNAALQWVPRHADLFERWLASLAPRGVLAFSVPGNFGAPSHTLLRQLADSPRWAERLGGARDSAGVLDPGRYLERLSDLGAGVDAWETTYQHVLWGPDPVFEWVSGTALRPYLALLDHASALRFSEEYRIQLAEAYPPDARGTTVFPFRRVFVVAQTAPGQP
jgi:trans-aconitate 2-methyltransferase